MRIPVRGKVLTADHVGLDGVSFSYGGTQALSGVSLELGTGTTALLGRNGAGKSTLCRILTGLETPAGGAVLRSGSPLESGPGWRRHHASTGWLPQTLTAPMSLTVDQYLRYGAWLKGLDGEAATKGVGRAISRTNLSGELTRRLKHLSGGTFRRVGIAQAVVHDPMLLVLDEPTVGLDPEQRSWFHATIRSLATERAVLMSTHLLEDVAAVADRVVVLDQGVVAFNGTLPQLRGLGSPGLGPHESLRSGFISLLTDRA